MTETKDENKEQKPQEQPDINEVMAQLKTAINPNDNPQLNGYIESSVNFLSDSMKRMDQSEDRDQTSKQIANELTSKFEAWILKQKEQREASQSEASQSDASKKA